jgi:EAL domain-containing protein (putative c-di-GMP-specific phosphodiesterase class I)
MVSQRFSGEGNRASDIHLTPRAAPTRDVELERAIAKDELTVLFQPQIEPISGRVCAVEALARWTGERDTEALMRDGYVDWLLEELHEAGLSPHRLTVEITESSLIADQHLASVQLSTLRDAGIQIAIDDFGTGYSNLAYLASLPLDSLKIDRAMIANLVGGSRDRIVVRAMIGLAHELSLKVIVEGVESTAQLGLVAGWGCDLYQGFLSAGALDEAELERFVAATLAVAA